MASLWAGLRAQEEVQLNMECQECVEAQGEFQRGTVLLKHSCIVVVEGGFLMIGWVWSTFQRSRIASERLLECGHRWM